jgi:antitoxin (DNA-binding transcriptional repressor) of toxin-antitoxin stability system
MRASILDLRRRMRDVLKALQRNERVSLTHRGKVIGMIQPASNGKTGKKDICDHPAFGMWADREDMKDPSAWVRKLRRKRRERLRRILNAPISTRRNRAH